MRRLTRGLAPAGAAALLLLLPLILLLASPCPAAAQQQEQQGQRLPWVWSNPVTSGYMAYTGQQADGSGDGNGGAGNQKAIRGGKGGGDGAAAAEAATPAAKPPVYEMPVAAPEEVGVSSELLGRLQGALDKFTQERKVPGSVVMVARHGKIIANLHSGYDHPNYIFRLFSQSKPVTAAATMILIDDGVLGLDDPVVKYIPEFKALRVIKNATAGAAIETVPLLRQMTIRHLLTHTGGLVYGDGGDSVVDEMYRAAKILDLWDQDLDGFIAKLARLPLLTQPGTEWRYSVGFDVLGAVIQRVSKMPLDQFMQQRLFGPLDMKDTGFWVPPEQLSRLVVYYTSAAAPGLLVPIPFTFTHTDFSRKPRLFSGGGGLVSTCRDYLRFGQMLLNRGELGGVRILKKETVELMWDNQLPPSMKPFKMGPVTFKTSDFGLGMAIQNKYIPAMSISGEAGWGGAASTNWWASPGTDTVIVAMTQVAPFFNGLAETVRPIVYTSLMDWEPPVDLIVATPKGAKKVEREDGTPLTAPTDAQAAKVGIGPILGLEGVEEVAVSPEGAAAARAGLKGAAKPAQGPAQAAGLK